MLRLSRVERQLIPPHFHLIPNHLPYWCSHAQGTRRLKLSSSEPQEYSLAQRRRNSCGLPSKVARLGTAVHLGIFLAWKVSGKRLQQLKEHNFLGMRCSGTHNNPDKPLETKSCGPRRSSSWNPAARLRMSLTIPCQSTKGFFNMPPEQNANSCVGTFPQLCWPPT